MKEGDAMPPKCTVCQHADVNKINKQLLEGVTLDVLSNDSGLSRTALHNHHQKHIPVQLTKSRAAKEAIIANSLMGRVAALNAKAEDVYTKSLAAKNLFAALGAIRELRSIIELYAKITGELQAQTVNNVIIMPEWVALRSAILLALEPYPEARRAVIETVRRLE
jgi:hypothetical protein